MQTQLKLTYDSGSAAFFLLLRPAAPADSVDYEEGVTLDPDAEGTLLASRSSTPVNASTRRQS